MVKIDDSKTSLEFVRDSLIIIGKRSIEPEYTLLLRDI